LNIVYTVMNVKRPDGGRPPPVTAAGGRHIMSQTYSGG